MKRMRVPRVSAALLVALLSAPAAADIPRPDRDRDRDGLAERVELGPIEPLPATTESTSRDGAGRLPRGVIVETEVAAVEPLQRETFLVTQTILDPARQLRDVEVHRPAGRGIDTKLLEAGQDTVEIDGRRVNRRHYRWMSQALQPGEVTLEFQRIDFDVVGLAQSEYAWLPVARRLTVTPLPAHLPEYLPVSPELTVQDMEVSDLVAGEPGRWRFEVVGTGLSEKSLERLLAAQLVAPEGIRIDKPSIRRAPDQSGAQAAGLFAEAWEVQFSLLPAVTGDGSREARLPALRMAYIDPAAEDPGAALDYAGSEPVAVTWQADAAERRWGALRAALPWLAAGMLLALVLGGLIRAGYRRWRARRDWRRAQRELLAAGDPRALRERLNAALASLPQPLFNPVDRQLRERGVSDDWLAARTSLERQCFSGEAVEQEAFHESREVLARSLPARWFR